MFNHAIRSALIWLQTNEIPIPLDIQLYMRTAMKVAPQWKDANAIEVKFTEDLNKILEAYRLKLFKMFAVGTIVPSLVLEFQDEIRVALMLNYIDAGMLALPDIAARFGLPADSAIAARLIQEWASIQADSIAADITKTTMDRLQSLANLRTDEGIDLNSEEVQNILRWSFGNARAETIAITEMTRAQNMMIGIYRMQLDKLGIPNNERWLTAEDEKVCEICAPADHKLKNEPIQDELFWKGRSWGEVYPNMSPHPRCRCKRTIERPQELVIPKSLKGGEGSGEIDGHEFRGNQYTGGNCRFLSITD